MLSRAKTTPDQGGRPETAAMVRDSRSGSRCSLGTAARMGPGTNLIVQGQRLLAASATVGAAPCVARRRPILTSQRAARASVGRRTSRSTIPGSAHLRTYEVMTAVTRRSSRAHILDNCARGLQVWPRTEPNASSAAIGRAARIHIVPGQWRWRWDLNPRKTCAFTRFRGVRPRPLGDSTAGEHTRTGRMTRASQCPEARRAAKKSRSRAPHSAPRTPPMTSGV
jgi:hypothetical protein